MEVANIEVAFTLRILAVERLEVEETLRVVDVMKGMVNVLKLKTTLDAFDVKPGE